MRKYGTIVLLGTRHKLKSRSCFTFLAKSGCMHNGLVSPPTPHFENTPSPHQLCIVCSGGHGGATTGGAESYGHVINKISTSLSLFSLAMELQYGIGMIVPLFIYYLACRWRYSWPRTSSSACPVNPPRGVFYCNLRLVRSGNIIHHYTTGSVRKSW